MPLTDSEATADSFYIGIVGLVLAGIEALLIWWRRFRNALMYVTSSVSQDVAFHIHMIEQLNIVPNHIN